MSLSLAIVHINRSTLHDLQHSTLIPIIPLPYRHAHSFYAKGNLSNFTASIHHLNKRENRTPNHAYEEYAQCSTCLHCDSDSRFISFHFSIHFLRYSFVCLTSHVQMRIPNFEFKFMRKNEREFTNDSFGFSFSTFILVGIVVGCCWWCC